MEVNIYKNKSYIQSSLLIIVMTIFIHNNWQPFCRGVECYYQCQEYNNFIETSKLPVFMANYLLPLSEAHITSKYCFTTTILTHIMDIYQLFAEAIVSITFMETRIIDCI